MTADIILDTLADALADRVAERLAGRVAPAAHPEMATVKPAPLGTDAAREKALREHGAL